MTAGWPRHIHDDLAALVATVGSALIPNIIQLMQPTGRSYAVIVAHLVALEEDNKGETLVHTADGRSVTVIEDIPTIIALITG